LGSFHICREYTYTDVASEALFLTMVMEELYTTLAFFTGMDVRLAKFNSSKI
jgi:hypothetical protein